MLVSFLLMAVPTLVVLVLVLGFLLDLLLSLSSRLLWDCWPFVIDTLKIVVIRKIKKVICNHPIKLYIFFCLSVLLHEIFIA